MKISTKILAAGLVAAAAMWTFSCDNMNAGDSEKKDEKALQEQKKQNLQSKQDENSVDAAFNTLQLPKSVLNTESKITLPAMLGEVKVTWASSNKAVIENNGAVHIPDGTGVTKVTLTATLTKGGQSKSKEFMVSVYQKNKTLTATEVLEAVAAADLAPSIDEKIDKPQTVTLKQSITTAGKTIAVSYQSVKKYPKHVQLDAGNAVCTVSRDIVDIPAELAATLSCDGKTKPLTVPVLIPRIQKFTYNYNETDKKTVSFDGSVLEVMRYRDGKLEYGSRYLYAADAEKRTLTLTKTEKYSNGKWLTKDAYIEQDIARGLGWFKALKQAYDDPSFENLKKLESYGRPEPLTDDALIEEIIERKYIRKHFPGITETDTAKAKAQFKALPDSKKREGIRAYAAEQIQNIKDYLKLPKDSDFDALIKAALSGARMNYEEEFFTDLVCSYTFTEYNSVQIETRALYDEKKPWHKQYGWWRDSDHNDLYVYRDGSATLSANGSRYEGAFNAAYTELTYTEYSNRNVTTKENGKWTFTFDKSKTPPELSAVNSVSQKKIVLQFQGKDLLSEH